MALVRPRVAATVPIANVAIPTALIVLVLLAGGLVIGAVVLAVIYLVRRREP